MRPSLVLIAGLPVLLCCSRSSSKLAPDAAPRVAASEVNRPAATSTPLVRLDGARGAWTVQVEVARSPEEHARGLMFRQGLEPDHGMLFVFDEVSDHSFWMHNTLIGLDMIFLGDDRSVVGVVQRAEPKTDTPRRVGRPSRYVLEVAAGEAAAHAVGPGARATFLDVAE